MIEKNSSTEHELYFGGADKQRIRSEKFHIDGIENIPRVTV